MVNSNEDPDRLSKDQFLGGLQSVEVDRPDKRDESRKSVGHQMALQWKRRIPERDKGPTIKRIVGPIQR